MIFVGDDSAENHHDVHVMDEAGLRLSSRRLPKGVPRGAAWAAFSVADDDASTRAFAEFSSKWRTLFFSYACWALAELVRPDSAIRP